MKIVDRFGRPIENLRIVVTTICNYNCIYCHEEGYMICHADTKLLGCNTHCSRYSLGPVEVELIGRVARMFEIDEVKLTGGEPLLNNQIEEIVSVLKGLGFRDISMVTNGYLLKEKAFELKESGLDRINVSLPSLKPDRYSFITRVPNAFSRVIDGIKMAKEVGIEPLKINVPILRGINEDEFKDFVEFALNYEVNVQFIEFHAPREAVDTIQNFFTPINYIEEYLRGIAKKIVTRRMHARKRYFLNNKIYAEVVRPMYNPEFCANCTRIRATPTGWKPCLMRNDVIDYTEELKKRDFYGLVKKFLVAVKKREPYFKD